MNKKDSYIKVSEIGYGNKIKQSFGAIIIGLILFFCSFAVLWWNEGRPNIGKIASEAITINANTIDSSANGKFVAVTNKLEATSDIIDPVFSVSGKYICLYRIVEMYSWVEETQTEEKEKIGGKTERITKYNYEKKWTDNPKPSSSFEYPEGHENPELPYKNETFCAEEAKVGAYKFSPSLIQLPPSESITLTPESFKAPNLQSGFVPIRLVNNFIYIGEGNLDQPQLGDVRISYKAVKEGKLVSLFGKLNGDFIEPYIYKNKIKIYKLMLGNRDEAILNLKTQHKMLGWIFRITGFLMMWIGMCMFFAPLHAFLQIIPALSKISKAIMGIILLPLALTLSIITIFISIIAHNIILLITILIILVAIIFFLVKAKKSASKK
jgi:hypothetical protein